MPLVCFQTLEILYAEAKQFGIKIRSGHEADAFLDHAAKMEEVLPESVHAVSLGNDLIFVRDAHVNDVRVLREELLHTQQQVSGFEISKTSQTKDYLEEKLTLINRYYDEPYGYNNMGPK